MASVSQDGRLFTCAVVERESDIWVIDDFDPEVARLRHPGYRALSSWPGDANLLGEVCRYSNTAGLRHHGRLVDRVVQVDPLTPVTYLVVSTYHWANGRFREAVDPARRACSMSPPASMAAFIAGMQIAAAGLRDEASEMLARTGRLLAGSPLGSGASFLQYALMGDREGALRFATPAMEAALQNEVAAMFAAEAYALIGRRDEAVRWARKAVEHGFINHPFLAEHDSLVAEVRGEPGFQRLLAEVKPRWEAVVDWERRLPA